MAECGGLSPTKIPLEERFRYCTASAVQQSTGVGGLPVAGSNVMHCARKHNRDLESTVDNESNALLLQQIGHFSEYGDEDSSSTFTVFQNEDADFEVQKQEKVFATVI